MLFRSQPDAFLGECFPEQLLELGLPCRVSSAYCLSVALGPPKPGDGRQAHSAQQFGLFLLADINSSTSDRRTRHRGLPAVATLNAGSRCVLIQAVTVFCATPSSSAISSVVRLHRLSSRSATSNLRSSLMGRFLVLGVR